MPRCPDHSHAGKPLNPSVAWKKPEKETVMEGKNPEQEIYNFLVIHLSKILMRQIANKEHTKSIDTMIEVLQLNPKQASVVVAVICCIAQMIIRYDEEDMCKAAKQSVVQPN